LDWADDVVELADALHIDRFTVLGYSWGGPYALACAYKVPHRLSTVGVVSSMSGWLIGPGATTGLPPGFRRLAYLLRIAPWLMYPALLGAQRNRRRKPEWVVDTVIAKMPPSDQAIVINLKLRPLLVQTVVEAWRQDVSCIYTDIMAISRPWGFSHQDIALDVNLWHGEQDTVIYPEMGRRLAAAIPNCRAVFYPDEGHFLIFARWAEILATLAFPSTVEVGSLERVIGDESTPQTG
jgi:pimeloyl-ACP methyl ester carboxylesterase